MGAPRAASRDACLHGHPWPDHLGYDYRGWAYCVTCDRKRLRSTAPRVRNYAPTEPDPVAIERAVAGDPPERLTPRERRAAVLAFTKRRLSATQIAEQIGCSTRTVHRARSRYAAAA